MKTQFMNENYLLNNDIAVELYHKHAKKMPIFDFHCHLNPKDIYEDRVFKNIGDLWLSEDHYKWRLLRTNGIEEKYITGSADDGEKFSKWAETIPYAIGHQLFHWTHLELFRYFGIDEMLCSQSAERIWEKCNKKIISNRISVRKILNDFNVETVCTTDDPVDSLEYHKLIRNDSSFNLKVLPTFRPDNVLKIEAEEFSDWMNKLSTVVGYSINSFDNLKKALIERIEFFNVEGCRASDHSLEPLVYIKDKGLDVDIIFKNAISGNNITSEQADYYKSRLLDFLGREYYKKGWVMQLHSGVIRDPNKRMMSNIGTSTGFDTIGDWSLIEPLISFLNSLDYKNELPKTVLYCINPKDNESICALTGSFQNNDHPCKIQFGSAWWFNDNKDGIEKHLKVFANLSLLGRFIGMLTDSRCYLSFVRHEYFRRIVCNLIGKWALNSEIPKDINYLSDIVKNISYYNSKSYYNC